MNYLKYNPKLDIFILLKQFKLGNILGLTPIFFKTNDKKKVLKAYPIVLIIVFVISCIFTLKSRSEHLYKRVKLTQIILDVIQCVSEIFFVISCLLGAVTKRKDWKTLLSHVKQIEQKLKLTDFQVKKSLLLNNINIIIYHMLFIFLQLYEFYDWTKKGQPLYTYVLTRIGLYYQLFELIFICKITRVLKRRYDYLLRSLNAYIDENRLSCLTCMKSNMNLNDICKLYKVLYVIVQQFNAIFGWQIFFILQCTVLEILSSINVILNDTYTLKEDVGVLIANLICSLVYIFSTITIVMSCDGVDQSGKEIVKNCFLFQDVSEKSAMKEDLTLFAKFAKELAPNFSAAGFFQINQSVLPTLFSAVATYLIIIIQFNMTL